MNEPKEAHCTKCGETFFARSIDETTRCPTCGCSGTSEPAEPKEAPAKDARELGTLISSIFGVSRPQCSGDPGNDPALDRVTAEIERVFAACLARAPSPSEEEIRDALIDLSTLDERAHKTGKYSRAVEYAASVARRCLVALLSSPSSAADDNPEGWKRDPKTREIWRYKVSARAMEIAHSILGEKAEGTYLNNAAAMIDAFAQTNEAVIALHRYWKPGNAKGEAEALGRLALEVATEIWETCDNETQAADLIYSRILLAALISSPSSGVDFLSQALNEGDGTYKP
jgi:hypothetical protein